MAGTGLQVLQQVDDGLKPLQQVNDGVKPLQQVNDGVAPLQQVDDGVAPLQQVDDDDDLEACDDANALLCSRDLKPHHCYSSYNRAVCCRTCARMRNHHTTSSSSTAIVKGTSSDSAAYGWFSAGFRMIASYRKSFRYCYRGNKALDIQTVSVLYRIKQNGGHSVLWVCCCVCCGR